MEGYNKAEVQLLGKSLVDVIYGFANGVGADDMANLMTSLSAGMSASNELKGDTNAAIFDVIAGMGSAQADRARDDLNPTLQLPPAVQ